MERGVQREGCARGLSCGLAGKATSHMGTSSSPAAPPLIHLPDKPPSAAFPCALSAWALAPMSETKRQLLAP